jgi:hypothetical protein
MTYPLYTFYRKIQDAREGWTAGKIQGIIKQVRREAQGLDNEESGNTIQTKTVVPQQSHSHTPKENKDARKAKSPRQEKSNLARKRTTVDERADAAVEDALHKQASTHSGGQR